MSAPQHYPLTWPVGRLRLAPGQRKHAKFVRYGKWITITGALERLEAELGRLGARYPLLSTNMQTTLVGRPRANAPKPTDPGVCVYFQLDSKPYALACDRYTEVADNVAAIAAHIEATRAIARHGVASAAETLQAFRALPAPGAPRSWWDVLGVRRDATPALVDASYRRLAAERHPDRGGSDAAMAELNAARDASRFPQ